MTGTGKGRHSETRQSREELLRIAYEGELIGVALYTELIEVSSAEKREPLVLLRDLEALTADAIEPLLTEYAVTVDREKANSDGKRLARQLAAVPWRQMWEDVTALADEYLGEFRALAKVLHDSYPSLGRQVVEHEEALLEFARREIRNSDDALEPLWSYLSTYGAYAPQSYQVETHEGK